MQIQKLDFKLACGRIENVPALKIFGIALKPHCLCNLFYRFILCKFTIRNLRMRYVKKGTSDLDCIFFM